MSDYYPSSRAELTTGQAIRTETQTGISAGEDGNYHYINYNKTLVLVKSVKCY